MEIDYDSGNFTIIGGMVHVKNLGLVRTQLNEFMLESKAKIEEADVSMWKHDNFPGYYKFLKIEDKYFLKGNMFEFNGRTDLITACYNNEFFQNPEDRGIYIIKKNGRTIPKHSPIIGRNPKLSDSGFFNIKIWGYKELSNPDDFTVKELLEDILPNDLSKKLMLK